MIGKFVIIFIEDIVIQNNNRKSQEFKLNDFQSQVYSKLLLGWRKVNEKKVFRYIRKIRYLFWDGWSLFGGFSEYIDFGICIGFEQRNFQFRGLRDGLERKMFVV